MREGGREGRREGGSEGPRERGREEDGGRKGEGEDERGMERERGSEGARGCSEGRSHRVNFAVRMQTSPSPFRSLPPSLPPSLQLESVPLLTKKEEFELGSEARRWLHIDEARRELAEALGRQPSAQVGTEGGRERGREGEGGG